MRCTYIMLALIFLVSFIFCSYAIGDPYDMDIKKLYSDPNDGSKIVYEIPIEVKMLDVSEDANWYKVYLKFFIGPLEFKSIGWAYIPVGKILAERAEKKKLAAISK